MNMIKSANKIVKTIQNNVLSAQVTAMLTHFETYNFLSRNKNNQLDFDFNSWNIKNAVKKEWLFTNLNMCSHPTFCFDSLKCVENFKKEFASVRNLASMLPFSLIEISQNTIKATNQVPDDSIKIVRNQFQNRSGTTLQNHTFCAPTNAIEFFYRLQRERKIWWRKFSAMPSRFHTTEICTDENTKNQFVEIKAEFPWGIETVEVITYKPGDLSYDMEFFEMKHLGKKCLPQVITCETSVEKATFTYLCDSFEKLNEDGVGDMLRFSKKLAPYKVAFACGKALGLLRNFKDLATLLANKMKKCEITVFLLPDFSTSTMEVQIARNDALGIPYTIILSEQTLKDGIISLRNRDTTLEEQSHVSLIVPYLEKIIKS